jgi:hypothetical protein
MLYWRTWVSTIDIACRPGDQTTAPYRRANISRDDGLYGLGIDRSVKPKRIAVSLCLVRQLTRTPFPDRMNIQYAPPWESVPLKWCGASYDALLLSQ